jgi:hypothetical protein
MLRMAVYVITKSATDDWDERFKYKFRHYSRDGFATAQEEFDRRRNEGKAAVLWRWEGGKRTLLERVNV